jgi:hypothetical protein
MTFTIGGQYFQAAVDYTYAVNDWLSIVPAVQAGYGINYYTGTRRTQRCAWALLAPVQRFHPCALQHRHSDSS